MEEKIKRLSVVFIISFVLLAASVIGVGVTYQNPWVMLIGILSVLSILSLTFIICHFIKAVEGRSEEKLKEKIDAKSAEVEELRRILSKARSEAHEQQLEAIRLQGQLRCTAEERDHEVTRLEQELVYKREELEEMRRDLDIKVRLLKGRGILDSSKPNLVMFPGSSPSSGRDGGGPDHAA